MSERIAVLAGGRSPEREISLRSGHRVLTALRARGYEAILIDPAEGPLVQNLSAARVSACYVALHGKEGEDGTVQRLLEMLDLPYSGTRPLACELTFDKVLAKEMLDSAGVPTPPWAAIQEDALRDLAAGSILPRVVGRLGLPLVVKPSRSGSAMGLSFVEHERELPQAVMNALSFSDSAVVERKVVGPEVAVGMLDGTSALPLVEIVPRSGVFDYAARYTPGATEYYAPARLSAEVTAACHAVADSAFRTLGLRHVARADMLVDETDRPWIVDVNVSPGMTDTSLFPMAAQAAGIDFDELCDRVLRLAISRA